MVPFVRGDISVYEDSGIQAPTGIVVAPDGDIWFTSIGNDRVGRVRVASGTVETFADPVNAVHLPANIFPAADGRLWFTCLGSGMLASIDPSATDPTATILHYSHPELDQPVAIKAGRDGRLWFTLRGSGGAIGSVDPCADDPIATLHTYRSPTISGPSALFADQSGVIWWVNADAGTIGRLEHAPATEVPDAGISALGPAALFASPRAWACDQAGWLWLTTRDDPGLLRFDPNAVDPVATIERAHHDKLVTPDGVWSGPDGALWLADTDADTIVRFDPTTDTWSFYGAPPVVAGPFDIKSGPSGDARLWFTNKTGNSIGSIATGS
jgi:virginiamycin B lyase